MIVMSVAESLAEGTSGSGRVMEDRTGTTEKGGVGNGKATKD